MSNDKQAGVMSASEDNKYDCPGDVRFGASVPCKPSPSQSAPLDKEAEKQKFIAWGQVFHRNARSYTARDFDHGFLGWLAAKSDAALARAPLPAQGGAQEPKPVAWMAPTAGCVMDAFLWQRDPTNPQYCVPVYEAPAQADEARDAARYRWLRDDAAGQFEHPIVVSQHHEVGRGMRYMGPVINRELDRLVDAAIAASLAGKDKP